MATDTSQSIVGAPKPTSSTISTDLVINGKVTSGGQIRLEGQVIGDIQCAALVLGENAKLEGSAVAKEVVIGGRLIGSVQAVRLTLQASSHVEGDLLCQILAIEQGAHFDGRSRRSSDPLSQSSKTIAGPEKVQVSADKALSPMGSESQRFAVSGAGVVHQNLA